MTKTDDGGPAFAALATSASDDVHHQPGMSLRDWFAGQALVGMMLAMAPYCDNFERNARNAYAQADAMLSQRSKGRADT